MRAPRLLCVAWPFPRLKTARAWTRLGSFRTELFPGSCRLDWDASTLCTPKSAFTASCNISLSSRAGQAYLCQRTTPRVPFAQNPHCIWVNSGVAILSILEEYALCPYHPTDGIRCNVRFTASTLKDEPVYHSTDAAAVPRGLYPVGKRQGQACDHRSRNKNMIVLAPNHTERAGTSLVYIPT